MKSQILKRNDELLITDELINHFKAVGNPVISIWNIGGIARVDKLSEYSTVRIRRGHWSIWINNDIAESMRTAYLEYKKNK